MGCSGIVHIIYIVTHELQILRNRPLPFHQDALPYRQQTQKVSLYEGLLRECISGEETHAAVPAPEISGNRGVCPVCYPSPDVPFHAPFFPINP